MIYFADLHIHSRYSRATSQQCNLVDLARWAALKGVLVLATGDCTHPEWSTEIRESLEESGDGLFRLKKNLVPEEAPLPGGFGPGDVRFVLNVEISSIYKKTGSVRKVHNLLYLPDLESMDKLNQRLDRIGNIKSDGRPILGLDSRDLLEIALETSPDIYLVPAHIWTPWFSILGSKSGFDSVRECFEDLTPHVFALETGLSSDPEMNHRVTSLDDYTLISSSDLHSPSRLARQANIFEGVPGYTAIKESIRAGGSLDEQWDEQKKNCLTDWSAFRGCDAAPDAELRSGHRFVGTLEFFPEEGKYHLDGHRKCAVRLEPEETERLDGKCPVCGKPVTVGVMNRVLELGDRPPGMRTNRAAPFWRQLPLDEIISQAIGVGPNSKRVKTLYMELLHKLGPELRILWALPIEEMKGVAPDVIVEGIRRVREGELTLLGGFDGEYGTVELFSPQERDHFSGQSSLVPLEIVRRKRTSRAKSTASKKRARPPSDIKGEKDQVSLNDEQQRAATICDRAVVVQAGPGTGKTRTLTHRIAKLIESEKALPDQITAVTFTRKAAEEIRERLSDLIPEQKDNGIWVGTFHQLGTRVLDFFRERGLFSGREKCLDEDESQSVFRQALKTSGVAESPGVSKTLFHSVSLCKQNLQKPSKPGEDDVGKAYWAYEQALANLDALDFDDLLTKSVELLLDHPNIAKEFGRKVAAHLLVDEFQDVNRAQYRMVRLLARPDGKGVFVIGDPDQAIYGFRGADWRFFAKLTEQYSSACEIRLTKNYRSQRMILESAHEVLSSGMPGSPLIPEMKGDEPVRLVRLPHARSEGEFIVRTVDEMMGGSSFFSVDSRKVSDDFGELGFRDFAVLYRLNAVGDSLEKAFSDSGIPYQRVKKGNPREESESLDPRAEAVTLMTIHASKGLEFPVVFLAGCEERIIPYSLMDESSPVSVDLDEERRLMYVAMTRAARQLFLTRTGRRMIHGRTLENQPSPFLKCIDGSHCESLDPLQALRSKRKQDAVQGELFQ